MGVFCLARRLFLFFHLCIFSPHIPASEGLSQHRKGYYNIGRVITAKQAIFRPYFARMRTLNLKKRCFSSVRPPFRRVLPCFCNFALYLGLRRVKEQVGKLQGRFRNTRIQEEENTFFPGGLCPVYLTVLKLTLPCRLPTCSLFLRIQAWRRSCVWVGLAVYKRND